MAVIVPLVLGGLALAVMAIVSLLASRRHKVQAQPNQARILIHAINDDRCTGCDACVAVCPTNVLDLVSNKSRVLRFQDCIQCEACMWACPTEALVMFPEGTEPPPVKVPDIDGFYQTVVPGQYLIGEVAGKPLVKNAANLGRVVIEHMLQNGLRPSQNREMLDVVIVGSGPGGMSAGLSCHQRGLNYLIIEKENVISSTVSRYPKGKLFMAEPYETQNLSLLPVFDSSKEEIVGLWSNLQRELNMPIRMHETVQTVSRNPDGTFTIATTKASYQAQRVVLATGTRGKPRTLGVPGEDLPKIESLLEDPDEHRGRAVLVVGGGDSALEAAMALAHSGAKVIMSYRGRSFHRAQAANRQKIDAMVSAGRIKLKLQSEVVEFAPQTVTLQMVDGTQKRYPNDKSFILIGSDPPVKWLSTLGIHYVEKPHMLPMPDSAELVRQLVSNARECPDGVAEASAQVRGHHFDATPPKPRRHTSAEPQRASIGRRFVRSASSLFGIGEESDAPLSLSEFAAQGQMRPRRDQLDPEERTRILRMLRDEGGRQADEDSKVYIIDGDSFDEDSQAGSEGSTGRHVGSSQPFDPPNRAVVEGLDRVTRPRGSASRPPRPARRSAPPPPPGASPTRSARPSAPSVPSSPHILRTIPPPTNPNPAPPNLPGQARSQRPSQPLFASVHEEATEHLSPEAAKALLGSRAPVHEEPTEHLSPEAARALLADRGRVVEEERTSLYRPGIDGPPFEQASGNPNPSAPQYLSDDGLEDSEVRTDKHPRTLSEVEWDLD